MATRKANFRSAISASVGARLVTTFSSSSSTVPLSRDCTSIPPATDLKVTPPARGSGRPPVTSRRRFFFAATTATASSVASGAMMTSVKVLTISVAASASRLRFSATMPPNADTGSQASAFA